MTSGEIAKLTSEIETLFGGFYSYLIEGRDIVSFQAFKYFTNLVGVDDDRNYLYIMAAVCIGALNPGNTF